LITLLKRAIARERVWQENGDLDWWVTTAVT